MRNPARQPLATLVATLVALASWGTADRAGRKVGVGVGVGVGVARAQPAAAADGTAGAARKPLDKPLFLDLEQARIGAGGAAGSLDDLRAGLALAQEELVAGNVHSATARLATLVESERFAAFHADPEFLGAELTLGRALVRGGAYRAADGFLRRVLAAGSSSPSSSALFGAGYRAMVDIALETREEAGVLARLDAVAPPESLPTDARNERAYLSGKGLYGAAHFAEAAEAFEAVGRQSRFFASALYFRGLVNARTRHYGLARRNLCEIVEQADNDAFSFFVDGRYWAIKDLAYLALGRIAHEQGRYDDAYYFYFRVPEESERLPDALFEAAWSMFQKGEYQAARAFIEQFDRAFPSSPLGPDVLLLRAMIELKSCRFDDVRAHLGVLVGRYAPLEAEVARLIAEPDHRRTLYRRLLARDALGREHDPIVELLKLDPRFYRYVTYLAALDREADALPHEVAIWDALTAARSTPGDGGRMARGAEAPEAASLVGDVEALVADSRGGEETRETHDDAVDLLARAQQLARLARPVGRGGPFTDETAKLQELGRQTRRLRAGLVDAAAGLAESALQDLDHRLRSILRQARLTHIDAVIGKKKRLEIEIANLQAGRYSSDLFGKLETEGLIRDDEEYWPYEGEYWADEYDNFR
jgi:tetratricopeptide (TPR) repeat protein